MKMLKASAERGVIVPVDVKKVTESGVYTSSGTPEPINNGYVGFFPEGQEEEAARWINQQRKKWGRPELQIERGHHGKKQK